MEAQQQIKTKLKEVETIDGSTSLLKSCVKIVGNYYIKGEQAIQIDAKWYPTNSGVIFFNHSSEKWEIRKKSISVAKGIVGIDSKGEFTYGEFTPDTYTNCFVWHVKDGAKLKEECMNYSIPKSLGLIEHINENLWATENFFGESAFSDGELAILSPHVANTLKKMYSCNKDAFTQPKEYKFEQNSYNIEHARNFEKAKQMYAEFKIDLTKDVKRAAKLLGDITFGLESEQKNGTLPQHLLAQLGIVICRDGSIGYTPEFVTVPLQGAKGLQTTQNLFIELNKRCTTDHSCSLHYHIGNVRNDREAIVAYFKLYSDVQHELHAMLPHYKTDPTGIKKDDKNYCKFLEKSLVTRQLNQSIPYKEKVKGAYNAIQTFMLEGNYPSKDFNRTNHRHPNGDQKWNFHSR